MKQFYTFLVILFFTTTTFSQEKGDLFRILSDEYSALTVRNDLMVNAKEEILVCTYIIEGDKIGYHNLNLLADAAQRGVQVRMILDGMGKSVPLKMLLYIQDQGVQIKIYNKKNWTKPFMIYRRLHGKMLVVDNQYCLIGGRNLSDQYYRMEPGSNFMDREVLIRSDSAVQEAHQHFNEMWEHDGICTDLVGVFNPADREKYQLLLDSASLAIQTLIPVLEKVKGEDRVSLSDVVKPTSNPVQFVYPHFTRVKYGRIVRSNRIGRRVTDSLQALVASADSTLDLESPYVLLTRSWKRSLKTAQEKGVRIRVITNSVSSTDMPLIQAIYLNRRRGYERAGIQLHEFCGDRTVHFKTLTVDKEVVMIGSYNLDKVSEKFNTEVAGWVKEPLLAVQQQKLFEKHLLLCAPPGGECPTSLTVMNDEQKKRKRKVKWLRYTLAPLVGLVL